MPSTFTFGTRIHGTPDAIRPLVEAALKDEGFGVITEIDVAATIKAKLGIDRSPYLILGACNPNLAHRALEEDPSIGALLPCNVVLRTDGDATIIEAIDPVAAMAVAGTPGLRTIAAEARARLVRAIRALRAARVQHVVV
jgi:uncharacterized protein (DUF302 family)